MSIKWFTKSRRVVGGSVDYPVVTIRDNQGIIYFNKLAREAIDSEYVLLGYDPENKHLAIKASSIHEKGNMRIGKRNVCCAASFLSFNKIDITGRFKLIESSEIFYINLKDPIEEEE